MLGGSSDYLGAVFQKIPTSTEEECEAAGKELYDSRELEAPYDIHGKWVFKNLRYMCVEGK